MFAFAESAQLAPAGGDLGVREPQTLFVRMIESAPLLGTKYTFFLTTKDHDQVKFTERAPPNSSICLSKSVCTTGLISR